MFAVANHERGAGDILIKDGGCAVFLGTSAYLCAQAAIQDTLVMAAPAVLLAVMTVKALDPVAGVVNKFFDFK